MMHIWNENIQNVIDYIEDNICDTPLLTEIAQNLGYSPYYLSVKFHDVTGMTLKDYIARRRLSVTALEIRDTTTSLIEIAAKYGYASQQSMTRAFSGVYGITPALYRRNPRSIPLLPKKEILFPEYYENDASNISSDAPITRTRLEYIPAHQLIALIDLKAATYSNFVKSHDISHISSVLHTIVPQPHPCLLYPATGQYRRSDKKGYFYGAGIENHISTDTEFPDSLKVFSVPASYYMVFFNIFSDTETMNRYMIHQTEYFACNYSLNGRNISWNNNHHFSYQRFLPGNGGYEFLRPVILM